MVKVSREWYDARIEVLDEFWNDTIDFEEFKKRIGEVDKKFKERKAGLNIYLDDGEENE